MLCDNTPSTLWVLTPRGHARVLVSGPPPEPLHNTPISGLRGLPTPPRFFSRRRRRRGRVPSGVPPRADIELTFVQFLAFNAALVVVYAAIAYHIVALAQFGQTIMALATSLLK